ncbi:hypothetical protein QVD17_40719 [Tagetes erecta]|uniref:PGG domain-containing protein n=1 Tax=Tagetes erecta TaxID=13708 RepID=A0AAD8JU47_TARER|nr:hypothetical protein QVD17_40719 [Tagetes erecta]
METGRNDLKFQLFEAARNGDSEKFATIATQNQNQTQTTILSLRTIHRNDTLLHIAAVFGHQRLTEFIANQFPDLVNCKNFIGDTPLHVAARVGKTSVVTSLLNMKKPPACYLLTTNDDGNTPLHEAVIHNQGAVVKLLLRKIQDLKNVLLNVNKKGKSPLYLAVESRNIMMVNQILNINTGGNNQNGTDARINTNESVLHAAILETITGMYYLNTLLKYLTCDMMAEKSANASCSSIADEDVETTQSVLHAAVAGKNIEILRMVAEKVQVQELPDNNNHLLHLAASRGFLDGVNYLLAKFSMDVFRHDEDGFCPIHLASKYGHLQMMKVLLDRYPDAREFLSRQHQNILHVAAETGKDNIVVYILKTKWAQFLVNEKDKNGYTPLHLATKNWHPKVVSALTWDDRVDLKLVNQEGLTALEMAENYKDEKMAPFNVRLTWIALRSAGTPRAHIKDPKTVKRLEAAKYEPYSMDYCKSRVNTLLLVSALVATVTFAAGFTMPGGYNSSGSHVGMASMLHKTKFRLFVICDSIAVYSSIIVTVWLMWAQLGDLNLMLNALRKAQRLLGLSLVMMSLAFLAGVDLVVTESHALSIVILVMGIASLIMLLAIYVPLFLPYTSKSMVLRYISYYPFKVLMLAS